MAYKSYYKRIHISGITDKAFNTIVSKFSNIENIIFFMLKEQIEFKLSNIPLCRLKSIEELLTGNNDFELLFSTNKTYFVRNKTWKEINYNRDTNWYAKCKKCMLNIICTNTNLRYPVLLVKDKKFFLEEE